MPLTLFVIIIYVSCWGILGSYLDIRQIATAPAFYALYGVLGTFLGVLFVLWRSVK